MEKQKISVKKVLEYKDALDYMEDLVRSMKSGSIVVESGGERVVVTPSDQISIKVEAKVKEGKQKIGFELSWADGPRADLRIGDAEPAPPPAKRAEPAAPARTESRPPATREPAEPPATSAPQAEAEAREKAARKAAKKAAKAERKDDKDEKKAAKAERKDDKDEKDEKKAAKKAAKASGKAEKP